MLSDVLFHRNQSRKNIPLPLPGLGGERGCEIHTYDMTDVGKPRGA